jgi:hypothetical protein
LKVTRKHFVAIAKALAEIRAKAEADKHTCELVSRALADVFAESNPAFDRARFVAACVKE